MDGKDGAPVGYLIVLKCNITEVKEEKTMEFSFENIENPYSIQLRCRISKHAPSKFPTSFLCWISDLTALSGV